MGQEKKKLLDKLYYEIGKQQYDFFVCGLWKKKNGEIVATKWKKYSDDVFPIDFDGTCREDWKTEKFFKQINQRQILPNELVLDIEEPEKFPKIIKSLKKDKVQFRAYSTGSRGFHIHLFFDMEIKDFEKLFYLRKYKVDEQKAYSKTMIALEGEPHWKTGIPKKELTKEEMNIGLSEFRRVMGYVKENKLIKIPKEKDEEFIHNYTKLSVEKKNGKNKP